MKKVTHLGYYCLYREVDGRHFVGHVHPMIGPLVKEIGKNQAAKLKVVPDNEFTGWTDGQVKSFQEASLKTLERLLD